MSKSRLMGEIYEYIKEVVGYIFEQYDIRCIPVSGFEIATKLGITLIPYESLDRDKRKKALAISKDGFIVDMFGKEYIYYNNTDQSYERQNMTILHEIGHILLDHTGEGELEEDEANFFAKYAIAPPILVYKIGANSPADIYDKFDISYEASCYAFSYYKKWYKYKVSVGRLDSYEIAILKRYMKFIS